MCVCVCVCVKRERKNIWLVGCLVGRSAGCFGLVLWHINHYRLFNAKSIFIQYYFKYFIET